MIVPKYRRSVGLISDLHAGSPWGPWPKGMTASKAEGLRPLPPAPGQLVLNDYLADLKKQFDNYDVEVILGLGDMLHGNNRKEWGDRTLTNNFGKQAEAAEKLLRPIVDGRKYRAVAGSKYHTSQDVEMEEQITKNLGGQFHGLFAIIPVKNSKVRLLITHGESGAWVYRETALAREALFVSAAIGRGEIEPVHAVIQAHWHRAMNIPCPGVHMIRTPGWTMFYAFRGGLKSYGKIIPHIGGSVLLIDYHDQITVRHITYPRPRMADAPVEAI